MIINDHRKVLMELMYSTIYLAMVGGKSFHKHKTQIAIIIFVVATTILILLG